MQNDHKDKCNTLPQLAIAEDGARWIREQKKPTWSVDNLEHQGEDETHPPISPMKQTTRGARFHK
jgi:hypothetical protein